MATFWVAASWVASSLQNGERGFYYIQDEDELVYAGRTEGSSYRLDLTGFTNGAFVAGQIERKYGTPVAVVGIGIDHVMFWPLPLSRERFRVLTPFRTRSAGPAGLKGWDLAERALRELAERVPQSSLVTFGVEPAPAVDFMPHTHLRCPTDSKLCELYSRCSVFLSASRREGFGLPMLEAMASGCPVVCTDAGGNREFCREGTAVVCPPGGLAAGMARVLSDPALAYHLSTSGVAESSRYAWPVVIDRLESLYGGNA